jgi:ABC-type sugar transport system permease subunit
MVPGLVMYRAAFYDERIGYASAIGTSMFLVILALTILNLRYVRSSVEYDAAAK